MERQSENGLRVAHYVRVSTEEQRRQGLSVDNQIQALAEYSRERGHIIVGVYNDAGHSARKYYQKRPEMMRLLVDCKGGKIDKILFTRLDRWERSVADYEAIDKILVESNVSWKTIWEEYDTSTAMGRFVVHIMVAKNQAEADTTGERIRSVLEYKKQTGEYTGRPPLGYIIKNKRLEKDPELEETISAFFDAYLSNGFSLVEAQKVLKGHGITKSKSQVIRMIKRTAYSGTNGYGQPCPAYITEEQRAIIDKHLDNYSRTPKRKGEAYIFSGIAFCGHCGSRANGRSDSRYVNKSNGVVRYMYYQCGGRRMKSTDCPGCSTAEQWLESWLMDNLDNAIEGARIEAESAEGKVRRVDIKAEKRRLEERLRRIGDRYEDGDISREEYLTKRSAVKLKIQELDLTAVPQPPSPLPSGWKEIYSQLDQSHKRSFWGNLIKKVVLYKDKDHEPDIIFL